MSDNSMDIGPDHLALANICINLAVEISAWPPEMNDRLADVQRRFTLVHATMLERIRISEIQRQQAEAEDRMRAEGLSEETGRVEDAIERARSSIEGMTTLRNQVEGVHGDPKGIPIDSD